MQHSSGISHIEAENLLKQSGLNEITAKPRQTPLSIFLSQFTSLLVILLIFASIASLFLGDILDGVFILLIVILNGILGFVQEYKAEKAINALKAMTISTVRVVRDGIEQEIDSKLLVPGDLIILEEGDKVPADCQLIEALHLQVNEASLTGESLPIKKDATNEEKRDIFLGTIIVRGRCRAVVTSTGMYTRFGKIASSLAEIQEESTPLQKKLDVLGKQLGILAIFSSATVFIIGFLDKQNFIEMLLTSISLAVAAVPEGLPAVITIALAVGMQRMARQNAVLRKLSSIEALGNTTVIATDKTGTLTKNEMRVVKVFLDGKVLSAADVKNQKHNETYNRLLTSGIICNNSSILLDKETHRQLVLGDTTEGALMLLASDSDISVEAVKESGSLIEEFPFDATLKSMSVIWEGDDGKYVYTKGAPESVLEMCTHVLSHGEKNLISDVYKQKIEKAFQQFALDGLRVLAIAERKVTTIPKKRENAEHQLTFLGLVGIADPPREEVKDAIAIAQSAGIRTMMITGDNEHTAQAIGMAIGLITEKNQVIIGSDFEKLTDQQALETVKHTHIFARITPDQKLRIVSLLQKQGHIVAVTGDGVNDALALKQSDIGVAMGITGTDVAKEASDMILVDDNYSTLVTAVEEGRTIFDNVKSAIKYLVGCNIGEVIAIVLGMLLGWPLILTPFQLLYINLITDGLPTIALAVTPKHEQIMKRHPRTNKSIFDTIDLVWLLEVSLLTAASTLIAFFIGYKSGNLELGRALAFTTIILAQQFILLDIRAKEFSSANSKILTDKIFVTVFLSTLAFQLLIIYTPFLSHIFKITSISLFHMLIIVLLSSVILLISESRKILLKHIGISSQTS